MVVVAKDFLSKMNESFIIDLDLQYVFYSTSKQPETKLVFVIAK